MKNDSFPPETTSLKHGRDCATVNEHAQGAERVGPRARSHVVTLLLIASLSLNALVTIAYVFRISRKGGLRYLLERLDLRDAKHPLQPFQEDWRARLRKLPNTEGEIVFAGDSIVASGLWSEFYSPIKNRGIGGETTAGLLERLDEITACRPRKIFLLIGTNCLGMDIPIAQVVRNYHEILERIRAESPKTRTYIISVLPVNQHVPDGPVQDNGTIRETNRRLRELAKEFGTVAYIDAFDVLTDAKGDLRSDLTPDGLHLSFDAYLILGKFLERYVLDDDTPPAPKKDPASPSSSGSSPPAPPPGTPAQGTARATSAPRAEDFPLESLQSIPLRYLLAR